jgi:UDPglucose 6-dehydrogenase
MNELSQICKRIGANINNVRLGIGSDKRIGASFLYAGIGYGGSCFPKDVRALAHSAADAGYEPQLLKSVEEVNNRQKRRVFELISGYFGGKLRGKTIALWGLSFKPNTDDMREASSRTLMESLWDAGATVRAYDPEAMKETLRIYGDRDDLVLCESANAALEGADALAIMTEWQEFRSPDFDIIRSQLAAPALFDGRNLYDPRVVESVGLEYYGIGRGRSVLTST